jgi:chromosome segregation ATPase
MSTYDHKKVLSDYANGRMDLEMAMGHSLQHIGKLYEGQATANTRRQEIRAKATKLEKEVKTLRAEIKQWQRLRAQVDRLRKVVDSLSGLNLTVYQLKDDVDSLKARLSNDEQADASARK